MTLKSFSQKDNKELVVYIYDSSWNAIIDITKAKYLMEVIEENDTTFITRAYNFSGSMITQESYRDKDLTITHGFFIWYDNLGRIDSSGSVFNGKKDQDWYIYNNDLKVILKTTFYRGKFVESKTYDTNEKKKITIDSTIKNEKVAEFKGGLKGLGRFLSESLEIPTRLSNLKMHGPVKASFYIDTLGKVQDIYIVHSLEWSADKEVIRVLSLMPKWIPAEQNGKKVKYSCIQPITFPDAQ